MVTFLAMEVRRHIAALALFGVHLLQGILPAAGAACDRQSPVAVRAPVTVAPAAHHHRLVPDVSIALPASAPVEHDHTPAACPMAMTCSVVGVLSGSVAVSTVDVTVDVHRPVQVAAWPVSTVIAPEPPPPRG